MKVETKNFWLDMFPENASRPIFERVDSELQINLLSEIGGDFWGSVSITKDSFLRAIQENRDVEKITVNVSSLGGDVNTALYINSLINKEREKVTVFYSGIVASAATWIGSDVKRVAAPATVFMIHESGTLAGGNKSDMLAAAQMLSIIDNSIFGLYSAMTGKTIQYFQDKVNENGGEWWMTATEALEIGLISEISDFAGATDVTPIPAATAKQFQITNSKYIMNEKSILNKIKDLILGGGDEGEEKAPVAAPVVQVKNELNTDERAELDNVISELRAKVDEMQALIERFTAEAQAQAETENELKMQVENLKKQVTAASIPATTQLKPTNEKESTLSTGAQKLLNTYGKFVTK